MKFAPLELCKKLVELGCKSESLWVSEKPERLDYLIPAFCQNDFTGCHEQAKKNVWLLLKSKTIGTVSPVEISLFRTSIMDSKDWVKFLEESLNEAI